jgi:hypothetical protein
MISVFKILERFAERHPLIGMLIAVNYGLYLTLRYAIQEELVRPASERLIECKWVLNNLELDKGKILYVGSANSLFPYKLALNRKNEVYAVDISGHFGRPAHFLKGDLRNVNLPSQFFDRITAISVIEHVGLGSYGDKISKDGDIQAMFEIHRLLKDDRKLLLTLPYGEGSQTNFERKYDLSALKKLLNRFYLEKVDFFAWRDGVWKKVAANCKNAIVILSAQKRM